MSATSKKRRKRRRSTGGAVAAVILILLVIAVYLAWPYISDYLNINRNNKTTIPVGDGEYIEVHIIDVGQGDSILVMTAGGNMLIDAGPGSAEDGLKDYLTEEGATEFEYAVFTHPHEDHIGGADMILTDFTVSSVILPDCTADSQTYERMMSAIDASGADIITAVTGSEYTLGSMTATILAPVSQAYDNLNNYSVVMKLTFGDTSFMLTGDAEGELEDEILTKFGADILKCDVLKVGHHGSDTATTLEFLKAVAPRLAAISCGTGNSYGHPHGITMSKLIDAGVTVYRTDESGTIVFISDGKQITVKGN
jgi:beta-lactamase superfamily II metal-dependent hydrolase